MVALPESARTLLANRAYGHLVTTNPSGTPQASMLWVDVEGDEVLVNTSEGRAKTRNMRRDPRVLLSVQDRDEPQQYLLIHGRVTEITAEGADEHIDMLSGRFLGLDSYPFRQPGEQRLIVRIAADRLAGLGPWAPMPGA